MSGSNPSRPRWKRWWWVLGVTGLAAAVAAAVLMSAPDTSDPAATAVVGPRSGQRAPQATVVTAAGDQVSLTEPAGDVAVVSFMSPGCPSCAEEVPALREVAESFDDATVTVTIVDISGVPPEQFPSIVAEYRDELGGGDRLVYSFDPEFEAVRAYEVHALGTTVVIGPDGLVTFRDEQTSSAAMLQEAVDAAGS